LSDQIVVWKILEDGVLIQQGDTIDVNTRPQQSEILSLDSIKVVFDSDKEYILEVSLLQKKATPLIPKYFEVAWDQFMLQSKTVQKGDTEVGNFETIRINRHKTTTVLNNKTVTMEIDNASGSVIKWYYGEKLITEDPIKLNFWRAPTDNDLGNNMQKWAAVWQDATYNYTSKLIKSPVKTANGVQFEVRYSLPNAVAKVDVCYTLLKRGTLQVNYKFLPSQKKNLSVIPKIGMYLTLPNSYSTVKWYGKGPGETYWDRKTGQKTGVHTKSITDNFHRYMRPQETGNKTDVRWVEVSGDEITLKAYGEEWLNTSVWPFGIKAIDFVAGEDGKASASGLVPVTYKHGADIQTGNTIQWNIDKLQMGVGGDNSWGAKVHDEYTIPIKEYNYMFYIEPTLENNY
jgi:beta-galactosidase